MFKETINAKEEQSANIGFIGFPTDTCHGIWKNPQKIQFYRLYRPRTPDVSLSFSSESQ
jgi:hypothetical protein